MELPPIKATDLFPDLSLDIDRRISQSQTNIKYWVICGVLANLMAFILGAVPVIYYLGSISAQSSQALSDIRKNGDLSSSIVTRTQDIEMRQTMLEAWATQQGYNNPVVRRPQ